MKEQIEIGMKSSRIEPLLSMRLRCALVLLWLSWMLLLAYIVRRMQISSAKFRFAVRSNQRSTEAS